MILKFLKQYQNTIITIVVAVVIYCFWYFIRPEALSYQEEYQMFLVTGGYFLERIAVPGGLADYLSEFLVQFDFIISLGALVTTLLLIAIQGATWAFAKRLKVNGVWYALSFVPMVCVWAYMGYEDAMTSFPVALLATLLIGWGFSYIRGRVIGIISSIIILPVFYWLFGPVVFVLWALMATAFFANDDCKAKPLMRWGFVAVLLLWAIAVIWLTTLPLQYPFNCTLRGLNYYRDAVRTPFWQYIVMAVFGLWLLIMKKLPNVKNGRMIIGITAGILVMLITGFMMKRQYTGERWKLIKYDYYVRAMKWDKIIAKATKEHPTTPYDMGCLNLALEMTDQLGERMFEFGQHGPEGLIPPFNSDCFTPILNAEIFYHLAMINEAQHNFFDAQAAIPNYRLSGRLMRRLAETNMVGGRTQVAFRYLNQLLNTLFYSSWAKSRIEMLKDKNKMEAIPEYYNLKKMQCIDDMFFSNNVMDQTIGRLYLQNKGNKMAYDYTLAYSMLEGNIKLFLQFFMDNEKYWQHTNIPRAWKEAYLLATMQKPRTINVDQVTAMEFDQYFQAYSQNQSDPALKEGRFGSSVWSYLVVGVRGPQSN